MGEHVRIQRNSEQATASTPNYTGAARQSTHTTQQMTGEVSSTVRDTLTSSGQPLDTSTRAFMEPRFGHDFSRVRIHTDEWAATSAHVVSALAYTVGNDVVFAQGQYNPGTLAGKRLLAHELTHVVQQKAGGARDVQMSDALSISDSSDSMEQVANETARRIVGDSSQPLYHKPLPLIAAGTAHTGHPLIQRFQAGDTGHGGIEKNALKRAGYSDEDVSKIYFGNWLRDFSQLAVAPTGLLSKHFLSPAVMSLINTLSLGEFGREVTWSDLGTYVPSEHLDNPLNAGTVEDPMVQDPKKSQQAFDKLSPTQKKAYEDEQAHIAEIQAATQSSGLPEYIEVGKFHAKRKLAEAIALKHTDAGMEAMGNGLHAIEDYFSHSNFVEVAIWYLGKEKAIPPEKYERLVKTNIGRNAALLGGNDPLDPALPAIITGTYASGYDSAISLIEQIQTEVAHGQLTRAFIIGWLIQQGIDFRVLGAQVGMSAEEVEQLEINNGKKAMGQIVDMVGINAILAAYPQISVVMQRLILAIKYGVEQLIIAATRGAKDSKKSLHQPTHSEIAKDAPDHPRFQIATMLAEYVDEQIGAAIKNIWDGMASSSSSSSASSSTPTSVSPAATESVTALVDTFVSHPARNLWWHDLLLNAIK